MGRLIIVAIVGLVSVVGADRRVRPGSPDVATETGPGAASEVLVSPSGVVRFELAQTTSKDLVYSVALAEAAVIEPSPLGIIVDGRNLADRAAIGEIARYDVDESFPVLGVHSTAAGRCHGAKVMLGAFTLDARACDDGAAFRYLVPGSASAMRTPDEATTFRFPAGATVWSHDFDGHYEGIHAKRDIADVRAGEWVATPLTVKLPAGAGYASVTESALAGYSGMTLRADGARGFAARLAHEAPISYPFFLRYTPDELARLSKPASIAGAIATPWRVIIAGRTLNDLVNADLVNALAQPPDRALFPDGARAEWIRPGRAVWRFLDGGDNTFDGLKAFTRFAEQLGFEYHVVEGIWQHWTDEQMRDFMADAKSRHVGIWLWKDSRALATVAEQRAFFDTCKALGVVGAKIDFFDHEGKEMIDRYDSILREAAERHIMLDFHGANKPTGGARTWPHELTREAVYGLEHRGAPAWAGHNTTLPFTRFLAGAADYTPVVFGDRRKDTSLAHQIATAVVFTSPLLVYGGHPQGLLESPAVELIKSVPSVWDETRVLPPSEIGEVAAMARRSGRTWFVGVLNGPAARTMTMTFGFLGAGRYDALLVSDKNDNSAVVAVDKMPVAARTSLTLALRAAGGFVAQLTPAGL